MDVLATIGLGMIGFLIGNLLFSKVGMWIATIYEITKDGGDGSKGARLAAAIFLGAGPWFLIATAMFAVYVHSESWAPPIFVGTVIAIIFFSLFAVYLARKARRKREHAA
jgi:xanthine/uracil permease